MRDYLVILFLLVCFALDAYGQERNERIGNPDDLAKIERPCPTFDLNCIRVFFQKHAHCTKVFGPAPDPIIRREQILEFPRVNVTVTAQDLPTSGINGRIEEFYINRETDHLVIAVEFQNLRQSTNKSYMIFHRRAKEPVVTTFSASVFYRSFVTTAVIPKIDDLQLDKAECTTFSNDAAPVTIIGPTVAESTDPQVQRTFVELLAGLPINVQEIFLTESFYFIATFIQYNICDFGLLLA